MHTGELGVGEYSNRITPTIVEGVHDVLDVQGGKSHYLVLKTTGKMYVAGSNLYGQLGVDIGDRTRTNMFTYIPQTLSFAKVSSSWTSNMAITVDGQSFGWGQNYYGELGLGHRNQVKVPTQITSINNVAEVRLGKVHSILRDVNGDIYTSGINTFGQLGNGMSEVGGRKSGRKSYDI